MREPCEACGSTLYARQKAVIGNDNKTHWMCNDCGDVAPVWLPDVFLEGRGGERSNEHLADPKTGQPILYNSKRQKAAILRMLGVREGGDARHGDKNRAVSKTRKTFNF